VDFSAAAQRSGFTLEHHQTIGSTNDRALDYLRTGGATRHFVIADEQTGGRGRLGRVWVSKPGNLYASLALIDPAAQAHAFQLGFVAAMVVYDTLRAFGLETAHLSLKWPNDVLVEGKKISGILLEGLSLPGGHQGVVIGCGINIAHHPSDTLYPVTDLKSAGVITSPFEVFGQFSASFEKWLAVYRGGEGFGVIRERWLSFAHGVGGLIVVKDRKEEKVGIFAGLDREGRLLLDQNGQIEPVIVGDVFFRDS
jgi:BirA family biotin operon repressor/biotin-[acetyl-CoA-carboxylase] ligase